MITAERTFDPRHPPEHIYRVPAYYRHRFGRMVPRVHIGATYSPAIRIAPAVHLCRDHEPAPSVARQVAWGLGLFCGAIAFVGLSTIFFGA